MKKRILILSFLITSTIYSFSQTFNLLSNGDFKSMKSWKANDNLRKNGKVTLLSKDGSVLIYNPKIDLDGSLYQKVLTNGIEWLSFSARMKAGEGVLFSATISFIAYDKSGKEIPLASFVPFTEAPNVPANWKTYTGKIQLLPGTFEVGTFLNVMDGSCYFSDVSLTVADGPDKTVPVKKPENGKGFTVDAIAIERPFWELFCDDLNEDGKPEIIACDVNGIVTVRNQGTPAFLTYAAGALVYQFEAADLNNDGVKEIIMSSVDPKIPVKAIDLKGKVVCSFNQSDGHERIAVGDIDGDGKIEIAVSKKNAVQGSSLCGGLILYNDKGEILWEKSEILTEFHFADIHPDRGVELIVGGPKVAFRIYNKEGRLLETYNQKDENLERFLVTDINSDGIPEIVSTLLSSPSLYLYDIPRIMLCYQQEKQIWETFIPPVSGNRECLIVTGDFEPDNFGLETAVIGTHNLYLYDSKGALIYRNPGEQEKEERKSELWWENFVPGGINSCDIAFWNEKDPHFYLSSSRLRHPAYYKLAFGNRDELKTYLVPDQEKHLEDIYSALKQRSPLPAGGNVKIKVMIGNYSSPSEETLRSWRHFFDSIETPKLEYLILDCVRDSKAHYRGNLLTVDKIAEKSSLYEKTGIPFGYWVAHSQRVWLSEEAIRKSAEAAPTMFRFLYICEDMELFYDPHYKHFLIWLDKTLALCVKYNLKLVLREKDDVWGSLTADPDLARVLFRTEYKNVIVPELSTNQSYEPEISLGGMLGLKMAGLCNEFGLSTQFWNWDGWGRWPQGIRDLCLTKCIPSDIILRLELMGIGLGATWIEIEKGQPYLLEGFTKGFAPMSTRHRELAYELIRKNILVPGATPVNTNKTTIIRSLHSEMVKGKEEMKRVAYPYYNRNTEALRKGFIPARYFFETYPPYAFPWLAYSSAWNVITCFPQTPNGWITILPPQANLPSERYPIKTDGEKILIDNKWEEAEKSVTYVEKMLSKGSEDIPLDAPGTCLIIQKDDSKEDIYTMLMIDPGYLAPAGVATTLKSHKGTILKATDMVSGESLTVSGNSCPVQIQPGAFRIIRVELTK
jgi:hypothetical protein